MRKSASYTELTVRASPIRRWSVVAIALLGLSCEDDYPLAPTFCDDWCRVTLRSGCDEQPGNCVRDCELTKASDDCSARQRRLLECYADASPTSFVCTGGDFQQEIRVDPAVCQAERDALYECEAPGIGTCLSMCRITQAEQLESTYDSATGLVDFQKLATDAGVDDACPAIDQPCEALCFSVLGFSSEALSIALDDPRVGQGDAGGFNPEATQRCIEGALLSCIFGEAVPPGVGEIPGDAGGGPPDANNGDQVPNTESDSDGPQEGRRVQTISDVLAECANF
jgi:hypothetical protein